MNVQNENHNKVNFTGYPVRRVNVCRVVNGLKTLDEAVLTRLDVSSKKDKTLIENILEWGGGMIRETFFGNPNPAKKSLDGDFFTLELPKTKEVLGLVETKIENGVPTIKRLVVRQDHVIGDNRNFNGVDELLIAGVVASNKNKTPRPSSLNLGYSFANDRFKELFRKCGIRYIDTDVNVKHNFSISSADFDKFLNYVAGQHQTNFTTADLSAGAHASGENGAGGLFAKLSRLYLKLSQK